MKPQVLPLRVPLPEPARRALRRGQAQEAGALELRVRCRGHGRSSSLASYSAGRRRPPPLMPELPSSGASSAQVLRQQAREVEARHQLHLRLHHLAK